MQLVELQRNVHGPQGDGVAVFGISYDPVSVLSGFAAKHKITYPLLADVGSKVIIDIGILNTQVEEERAFWGKPVEDRHRGLPFPGTFMLDEDGIVVDKAFERSHRIRPGGKVLLERLGVADDASNEIVTAEGPGLAVAGWVDSREYFPNQLIRLTLRLVVDDEFHVYVPPNPSGFTNLSIDIDTHDGVFVHDSELPGGHLFSVEGFTEEFTVADGEFDIQVPFYILEDSGDVTLPITVHYQACSATMCLAPDSVELSIDVSEIRA